MFRRNIGEALRALISAPVEYYSWLVLRGFNGAELYYVEYSFAERTRKKKKRSFEECVFLLWSIEKGVRLLEDVDLLEASMLELRDVYNVTLRRKFRSVVKMLEWVMSSIGYTAIVSRADMQFAGSAIVDLYLSHGYVPELGRVVEVTEKGKEFLGYPPTHRLSVVFGFDGNIERYELRRRENR